MKLNEILEILKNYRNGAFIKVVFQSELPLNAQSKRDGFTAKKITEAVLRKGIDYSNLASTKKKVDEGYELSHELPWGEWKDGCDNLIITHKGNDYLRLYASKTAPKTKYFVNDEEMNYDELKSAGCLINSFFNKKDNHSETMTMKIDNILSIG